MLRTKELDKIMDDYERIKDAEYQSGLEMYKLKDGSLITQIEYRRIKAELDLRFEREKRKQERGVRYVD